ncbi:WWE domain protein [Ancylostoma duodenale]|uniref:E3 ubiquitin-protein ligase n=1 Tax=Ancylostoma duodenale TaxID=51022 RepID=A0A0C2GR26_9BILA|nr:WWE domain protein [Ancylostoma duodenale]
MSRGAAIREGEATCPTCRGDVSPSIFKKPVDHGATLDMHDPESPSVALKSSRPRSSGDRLYKRINPADCDTEPPSKKATKPTNSHESPGEGGSGVQECLDDDVDVEADPELRYPVPARFYWLYKGRGGWWRFDPRLEKDIEAGRAATPNSTDLIICGYAYVLDFVKMVQYRKETPTRTREIKRVSDEEFKAMSDNGEVKGISGVRVA